MGTIGIVGYLNARPLVDDLDRSAHRVIADHPSAIAQALTAGEVDLALSPVAAVLNDGDFRIVPGWCIGSIGPVDSVLLVAEVPPERWTRVVLDGVSRTSAVLARLLLAGPLAARVTAELLVEDGRPGCALEVAHGTTAALIIGDVARELPARLTERLDLAALWRDWTGLPFVFAVWAGRPDLGPELREAVREAGARGVAAIGERFAGDVRDYLGERLRYPLDDRALMGLRRFAALGHAQGLLAVAEPSLFEPTVTRQPRPDYGSSLARAVDGVRLTAGEARALAAAPVAELAVAADLRRSEQHGSGRVNYRLAAVVPDAAGAVDAVARGVALVEVPDLEVAAAVRLAVEPGIAVRVSCPRLDATWLERAAAIGVVVTLSGGQHDLLIRAHALGLETVVSISGSEGDAVEELLALRSLNEEHGVLGTIRCAQGTRAAVRATALARVLLDVHSVEAAGDGSAIAQAGLRMGCDHYGTVTLVGESAGWPAQIAEVERQIREGGFHPVREDPTRVRVVRVGSATGQLPVR